MKDFIKRHINDFNPAVKIFKSKYKREPLDLDELLEFLLTLNLKDVVELFDK